MKEDIIGLEFKVQSGGFIRVVDAMGDDAAIVQAARISYGAGTKKVSEDRGLIRYLLRHRHTTPLEMCELKLHVKVPMDTWRQWIRHRMASVNEYSTRYSVAIDECQTTLPGKWREQSGLNNQGSRGFIGKHLGADLSRDEREIQQRGEDLYKRRIQAGVAREQARKDLPLSTYTEAYWKIDLHNLLHFLSLRMDNHAQLEIREYANIIGNEIVAKWCPNVWEAFRDYSLNAMALTVQDIECVRILSLRHQGVWRSLDYLQEIKWIKWLSQPKKGEPRWKVTREATELQAKLERLGIGIPWQSVAVSP